MDCVKSLFLYDATLLSVVCRLFSRYKEGSISQHAKSADFGS